MSEFVRVRCQRCEVEIGGTVDDFGLVRYVREWPADAPLVDGLCIECLDHLRKDRTPPVAVQPSVPDGFWTPDRLNEPPYSE